MNSFSDVCFGIFIGIALAGATYGLWGPISRLIEKYRPIVVNYRHACTNCKMPPEQRDVPDRVRHPRVRRIVGYMPTSFPSSTSKRF